MEFGFSQWVQWVELPVIGFLIWRDVQRNKELNDLKVKLAEEYPSIAHLKDVEGRLVKAVDELKEAVTELRTDIRQIFISETEKKRQREL